MGKVQFSDKVSNETNELNTVSLFGCCYGIANKI